MTAAYPVLSNLLSSYFPEEWDRHGGSDLAIERMLRETPIDTLRSARGELDELLSSGVCEPQLTDVLQFELGCNVTPSDEGMDASGWLEQLRRTMSRAL